MIKAIIFDCFGVVITDALQALTDELGTKNPHAVGRVKQIIRTMNKGVGSVETARQNLAKQFGITKEQLRIKVTEGETKDNAVLDYVKELRRNYKTAMLSNIPGDSLRRRFEPGELESHFDAIVASGDIGYAKPERQAYQHAASQLGVEPKECVFIDDREGYVDAARELGMQGIVYKNLKQTRGELEQILAANSKN
jgi:HAD superfamily hydrolase (TIGR01509 family)